MKTLHWIVDPAEMETPSAREALAGAAAILRAGGLVGLPTETVYGLGANALDQAAVERIFAAKGRPAWDPVIVHVADAAIVEQIVREIPEGARKLMAKFWPGPLTLLLPRSEAVPDVVTAGRPLVGVRMPAHPVALELIRRAGVPVAAPSANRFGHISPTTATHVLHDLDGRIDAVVDAGPTQRGVESTVIDATRNPMMIYRPGAVTAEEIRVVVGAVEIYTEAGELTEAPKEALPSPGAGLRHYAPRARLLLVDAPAHQLGARLNEAASAAGNEVLGVMLPDGLAAEGGFGAAHLFKWGRWDAPEEMARTLYAGLRALDAAGCTVILCPLPAADGIGAALRDRLRKAATR